jgi:hypothetical protein
VDVVRIDRMDRIGRSIYIPCDDDEGSAPAVVPAEAFPFAPFPDFVFLVHVMSTSNRIVF